MVNKPRQISSSFKTADSNSSQTAYIKWCSFSSPRPAVGIPNVLYINTNKQLISIWSPFENKYIEFYNSQNNVSPKVTTNNNIIEKSSKLNEIDSSFTFSLIDDNLIITSPNGIIQEIPISKITTELENKIKVLEERINKLEELLN